MEQPEEVVIEIDEIVPEEMGAKVLVVGAKELSDHLIRSFGDKASIVAAEGLKDGNEAIDNLHPKLVVCALEGETWTIIPLLHNARQHGMPILAVTYTQEAIASAFSLDWAVDRKRKDAVVAVVEKMLEDPTFVPDDPARYPSPPTKAERAAEKEAGKPEKRGSDNAPTRQRTASSSPRSPQKSPVTDRSKAEPARVDEEPAVGLEPAGDAGQKRAVVTHVLEHLDRDDTVEETLRLEAVHVRRHDLDVGESVVGAARFDEGALLG